MAIILLDEVDSTNLYVKQNFDELNHLDVVIASRQTAGYGRFKRNWIDLGLGNIFMSIYLKSDSFNPIFANLTQYASLKLVQTFENFGLKPSIKWPNDILINDKKIAGILAESIFMSSKFVGVVLGLGVNLSANFSDLLKIDKIVTSLNLELNSSVDKSIFYNEFLNLFYEQYDEFLKSGFISIKSDYLKYLNCMGKLTTITQPNSSLTGVAKTVTDAGLLVLDINGVETEISTGDVN